MSAAVKLPTLWTSQATTWSETQSGSPSSGGNPADPEQQLEKADSGVAFYRRRTESLLRRYLYTSMQVGRTPSLLDEPVARGWVSNRPVHTFEDAVIFVLDMERCLEKIGHLEQQVLSRIVLQDYSQLEAAGLLGMSPRALHYKYPQALDQLTEQLLDSGLLALSQ